MIYALIDNNTIKVGPRDYHVGFFNDYLQSKNISFEIPFPPPTDNSVIKITDEISIVPVQIKYSSEPHIITEQLAGPFYEITNDLVVGTYNIAEVNIESAKNKFKEFIANVRYNKENTVIKVTIQDTEVSILTHRGTNRDFYTQTYLLMNDNDVKLVKFPIENVWLSLTKADFLSILNSINTTVQSAFDWEHQQLLLLENADKTSLETQYNDIINS